jgi:RNA polymerase sigma factor (sigma-70 family)
VDMVGGADDASQETSEAELITAAAAGDDRAWRRLVHRYKRLVYSIPRGYRLSESNCDDVFQTVFAALVRELPRIKDVRALPKWVITTAHRECWRIGRRAEPGALREGEDGVSESVSSESLQRWERAQQLDRALSDLGGKCERLLRLLYLSSSQIPYEELSSQLGMPVGSIGPTRQRCLSKLAQLMPRESEE